MILHKMNGQAFEIKPSEIRDVRSSGRGLCAFLILAHEFLPVREAVSQVRRIMRWEIEGLQSKLDL